MDFTEAAFFDCVEEINKQNYSYGNEILYRNCGFEHLPVPGCDRIDTKLSSMIWLIGKSYSADPTRSAPADTFSDKGLGGSFERIAQKVYDLDGDKYAEFYNNLDQLRRKHFHFDQNETDQGTLQETVQLVGNLNNLLKEAMTSIARDKKSDASESANVISFCSKFLHFMCPDLFFIYDSFSYSGGSAMFGRTQNRVLEEAGRTIRIDGKAKKYFKPQVQVPDPSDDDFPESITTYYQHCLRAYALASILKNKGIECEEQIPGREDSRYMPRLVDSVLMRIKKEAEK